MSTVKPPKTAVNKENDGVCQNLLSQRFDQKAPNMVWVCDFTYVKVGGKFHYICAILDLYARKVIACRVGSRIDRFLALDTLWDEVRLRGVSQGVMFHTDRGSQFTSGDFCKVIDELGMVQSFSAKGHPYDNAVMECFFKYLKKEELDRAASRLSGNSSRVCCPISSASITPKGPTPITTVCLPTRRNLPSLIILLVHFIDYSPQGSSSWITFRYSAGSVYSNCSPFAKLTRPMICFCACLSKQLKYA